MFILIVPALLPAVLMLVAPSGWVRAVTGWMILVTGLIMIDNHVVGVGPYDDDGVFPSPVPLWAWVWAITMGAALFLRQEALLSPSDQDDRSPAHWACTWSIPVALLVAAAFVHWLSNRLAGASPAALVHLGVIGSSLAASGGAAWLLAKRQGGPRTLRHLAVATPLAVAALASWQAMKGFDLWNKARAEAGGAPHCVVTHAGIERSRKAANAWELSPLVNRKYGIWAASKGPVLVVRRRSAVQSLRRINGKWRDVSHGGRPLCVPPQA